MKTMNFALLGAAVLMVGACSSNNPDQVNNAEMNQSNVEELNTLANEAASNAEADTLANQQNQLNQESNATSDNTVNPADADEQNVSGM